MRVDLHTLKPNRLRHFTVDPIDQEAVRKLRQSIKSHGFWGGLVCRRLPDGAIQIGDRHHRVEAALGEGITEAELAVHDDRDDAWMVEVYAAENYTQRGSNSLAEACTVAGPIRGVAKAFLTGVCHEIMANDAAAKRQGDHDRSL